MLRRLAAVAILVLTGCGATLGRREDVEKYARITIPATATDLRCRTERGLDAAYWGRFDLPAADLPEFLAQVPADGRVADDAAARSPVMTQPVAEPWWHPGEVRRPRTAEWSSPGFTVNLLFGESERTGVVAVYFFNFSR